MSVTRRHFLNATAAGVALFAIGGRASAKETRMRFAHPHPEADSWHIVANQFAERIKNDTNGEYIVEVFGNGMLGSDQQTIGAVRGGTIDFGITGNPFFTGLAPKLNVLDLPFLFDSRAHVGRVMDGEIGNSLRAELEGSDLKAIATWDIGWRNLTNNRRAVATPDDLKGLKIRTTPNPAHIKAFELLGAVPTPMAFTELFTALETGTVDGQENPVTLILNARFFEVQKYLTLSKHAFTTAPLVMNLAKFNAYPADLQEILLKAGIEMAQAQRQMNEDSEAGSLAALKEAGMEVVETPDRAAFAAIVTESVEKDFVEKFGPELIEQIRAQA